MAEHSEGAQSCKGREHWWDRADMPGEGCAGPWLLQGRGELGELHEGERTGTAGGAAGLKGTGRAGDEDLGLEQKRMFQVRRQYTCRAG